MQLDLPPPRLPRYNKQWAMRFASQDFDAAKRIAERHQTSVSEVIRAGLRLAIRTEEAGS